MQKTILSILVCCTLLISMGTMSRTEAQHRLGAGVNYWVAVDKFEDEDLDDKGFGGIISYQYLFGGLFRVEADLEILQEGYAGARDTVYTPMGYFIIGRGLYAGLGLGLGYSGGEWADEPFYALRAGLDINILPKFYLDINANYRFIDWKFDELKEDIDLDTITLGAVVRFEF
jgi:Outer membrane protein beta-barrel domain